MGVWVLSEDLTKKKKQQTEQPRKTSTNMLILRIPPYCVVANENAKDTKCAGNSHLSNVQNKLNFTSLNPCFG